MNSGALWLLLRLTTLPTLNHERESDLNQNGPRRSRCVLQYPSELTQALRNFLTATRDSSPAMMPSSHSGLVGTGVATVGTGGTGVIGGLLADGALVPTPFVAVTVNV